MREYAEKAVWTLRAVLERDGGVVGADKQRFMAVFDQILLPYMKEDLVALGRSEFERLGKEHVRSVVLGVFDKFIEGKN
jgi:hypothetical protein